jgi:hypothetical protein
VAFFVKRSVDPTTEFHRIHALPVRDLNPDECAHWARQLTADHRTHEGEMNLHPIQGAALWELRKDRGLLGGLLVGAGKTLVSLLAPKMIEGIKRPVLLLPAALIPKTEKERRALERHWRLPKYLRLMSYEALGRVGGAKWLADWRPDMIISDECQRLKNRRAAVTRRVARYMKENPSTVFVALSGTILRKSLKDFAHLARWALKDGAPVPDTDAEVGDWADALDVRVSEDNRLNPGPIAAWCPVDQRDEDVTVTARRGFRQRLITTPGVVMSTEQTVACSIYINALRYDVSQAMDDHFKTLREKWETPDGWAFSEATMLWAHSRQLALGLHYVWDPRPPEAWIVARRRWAKFVRNTLSQSRKLDSEKQVAEACQSGALDRSAFDAWCEIQPSFTPNSKALWHDDGALGVCQVWANQGPGIIWTDHSFFARRLSQVLGLDYYGQEGKNARGEYIEEADPSKAIIASRPANSTGRNLQTLYSRNLITTPPSAALDWEQLIGRTHRLGQEADEVTFDVLCGCFEHVDAMARSIDDAKGAQDLLGNSQKLLIADITYPTLAEARTFSGARWAQSLGK